MTDDRIQIQITDTDSDSDTDSEHGTQTLTTNNGTVNKIVSEGDLKKRTKKSDLFLY